MKNNTCQIDTQGYMIFCKKLSSAIMADDCERCEHHRGFFEIWPKEAKLKAGELSMKPIQPGKLPVYQLHCALPQKLQIMLFAKVMPEVK